jgi:hypothetical protein
MALIVLAVRGVVVECVLACSQGVTVSMRGMGKTRSRTFTRRG